MQNLVILPIDKADILERRDPSAGMEDIAEKVRKIVADQLEKRIDEVRLESRFADDLGADSLDTVELVMALEDAFNLEILDEDAERMKTVKDLVKYLEKRLQHPTKDPSGDGS